MSCPAGRPSSKTFETKSLSGKASAVTLRMMVSKLSSVEHSTCIRAARSARAQITAESAETSPELLRAWIENGASVTASTPRTS